MLSVCTSSTESTLAFMGDLLTVLGATASSSGMDMALSAASAWVERYVTGEMGGVLRRQVYTETVAGYGTQRLRLSRRPVLGIQRMFTGTDTGEATEYCSTDYRLENPEAGFLELTHDGGFGWTVATDWTLGGYPRPGGTYRPFLVVYEAGYQLVCSSSTGEWVTVTTGRTLPEDIERAVLLKAAEFYGDAGGGAYASMKVGPLGLTFKEDATDPVAELLAMYRSV